ncbi:MarR family winged helix-turn-helix transcriptional regulator [Ferroacidibacillus organovorans]|nr:MarR family transcriptional regulator [Ferroacidibacillus organovorans]
MQNIGPHLFTRTNLGLTPGQIFMLHVIQTDEHCTVSRLAEKLEVNPSAITVMLDRLEQHNYVARMRDGKDRRVVHIHLTTEGSEKMAQVLDVRKRVVEHCLSQLTDVERETFLATLKKLADTSAAMELEQILTESEIKKI